MRLTYFADTGDWGDALQQNVYDTTDWTVEDWEMIDRCADSERQRVAGRIDGYRRLARSLNLTGHRGAMMMGDGE